MSKVAALLSAFYCERYLKSRVENLLAQVPQPEIWVVCQRGSAEHTILEEYKKELAMHVIVRAATPSVYDAWNAIIDQTSCDYLVTANADDLFYPGALKKMSEKLDAHPEVAVVYPNCDITAAYKGLPVGRYEMLEFDLEALKDMCYMGPMPMWRKSLHDKYGPFDSQLLVAGDYEFWLRIASEGEKLLHLAFVVGAYLDRPDSREHRERVRTLWETARVRSMYDKENYGPTNSEKDVVEFPVHSALSDSQVAIGDAVEGPEVGGYLHLRRG